MIEHDEICGLMPHAENMCLLDRVTDWDESTIVCESSSHMLQDNPLRTSEGLTSVSLIEYGAQSMAVHGGLIAREKGGDFSDGYLAALRDVSFERMDVSHITNKIVVMAEMLMSQNGNLVYSFHVSANDECIVHGRATVVEVKNNNAKA